MMHTIQRLPDVKRSTGLSRSTIYLRISQGTFSQAGELGWARGRLVGSRSSGVATAANRSEPQGQGVSQRASPTVGLGQRLRRKRHPNYRLVKIHRSYTVEEIARLFGCHRNTVRDWIKRRGLPTIDDRRPMLIHGRDLVDFLQARRRRTSGSASRVKYIAFAAARHRNRPAIWPTTSLLPTTRGNLVAICSSCESMIYRRVNLGKLEQVRGNLEVTMPQALPHIVESSRLSVNSDLGQGGPTNANAQRK